VNEAEVKKTVKSIGKMEGEMRKMDLLYVIAFILVLFFITAAPVSAFDGEEKFARGSMYMAGQIGFNSYVTTDDPFESLPFPLGASYEFLIADNIGIGASLMFDKWSDYLGMFGGKYTFWVFKPSLDITYHFHINRVKGLNLFTGANLGYSLLSVSNVLGNPYDGDLKNEPYVAPFFGTHIFFWENSSFLNRFLVTLKVYWSVLGDFSGVYGTFGITYKIK
jgi:hypothetical protein